jgi:hypothetical protein
MILTVITVSRSRGHRSIASPGSHTTASPKFPLSLALNGYKRALHVEDCVSWSRKWSVGLRQIGHYEECRLLGYENPVRTSQETQYVSATELSQLMLCKI